MLLIETQLSVNNYQLFLFFCLLFGLFPNVQLPLLPLPLPLSPALLSTTCPASFDVFQFVADLFVH